MAQISKMDNALLQKIRAIYPIVSIVYKSDIDRAGRFDAECLIALNLLKDKYKIEKSTTFSDKSCIEIIDGDRGKNYPNGDDFSDNGHCLFLNTSNVLTNGFNLGKAQFITQKKDEILGNGKLRRNDIVFTTRGTIGNIGIYNEFVLYENLRINSGMVIFRLKNINPEFFFALLLSPYIKNQINAFSSGSVQKQIPIDSIEKIQIPILPESFQLEIESIVKSAHEQQTQSKALYQKAEQVLLQELGLWGYKPVEYLTYDATKKEVDAADRFDAEYFQPKYKEIEKSIQNYKGGFDVVGNILSYKKGIEVGSDFYREEGKGFFRVSDFSIYGFDKANKKITGEFFEEIEEEHQPEIGEILFTKDGTLGITQVIKKEIDGVLSSAFLRCNLNENYSEFEKETLCLLLNSIACQSQVEKFSGGGLINHLKPSDFGKIKIPLIAPKIQEQIAELVQESHNLRESSKELLETAKHKVEQKIESLASQ